MYLDQSLQIYHYLRWVDQPCPCFFMISPSLRVIDFKKRFCTNKYLDKYLILDCFKKSWKNIFLYLFSFGFGFFLIFCSLSNICSPFVDLQDIFIQVQVFQILMIDENFVIAGRGGGRLIRNDSLILSAVITSRWFVPLVVGNFT